MPSGSPGGWCGAMRISAYRTGSPREDLSFDRRDNARGMPKAVVVDETFNWGRREIAAQHPLGRHHHLRSPRQGPDATARGRAAAICAAPMADCRSPAMIDHLKRLGVTTIELLPIHALDRRPHLVEKKLCNYWGYNTLGFFAPEPRYAQDNRARRLPHHGGAPARCRHRGHARRRLQPHRRRQSPRARRCRSAASTTPPITG